MNSREWQTPQEFFDRLNLEFSFTVDVAATPANTKCERFYTPQEDGLSQNWEGEVFWCNPPYGRGQNVYAWVKKAFYSAFQSAIGVCLLPASTDTKWFHDFCMHAKEIRFIRDRLWFSLNGKSRRANHASMVVIFDGKRHRRPKISSISNRK